jgi:hypothetical protein
MNPERKAIKSIIAAKNIGRAIQEGRRASAQILAAASLIRQGNGARMKTSLNGRAYRYHRKANKVADDILQYLFKSKKKKNRWQTALDRAMIYLAVKHFDIGHFGKAIEFGLREGKHEFGHWQTFMANIPTKTDCVLPIGFNYFGLIPNFLAYRKNHEPTNKIDKLACQLYSILQQIKTQSKSKKLRAKVRALFAQIVRSKIAATYPGFTRLLAWRMNNPTQ